MSDRNMERSWLVQRLNEPAPTTGLLGADNPFAFGGGYKNGGLSDDAMRLLRGLFSFDYMGAAEFEFGAVPEALSRMLKAHRKLVAFAISDIDAPVYVLAQRGHAEAAAERIKGWAGEYDPAQRTKEAVLLRNAISGDEWCRTRGWLELDNGFFFTIDEAMWAGVCDLFGVKRPAVSDLGGAA